MKTLAGLTALAIVLIGSSALLTNTPGAQPAAAGVELTESPTEDMPPFIHLDPSDWH
jgi:hypothetical protein